MREGRENDDESLANKPKILILIGTRDTKYERTELGWNVKSETLMDRGGRGQTVDSE